MKKILIHLAILVAVFFSFTAMAQIQYSNEFWISTNATGNIIGQTNIYGYTNTSIGTLDSPLDGSTQARFDENMGSLPPNSTIHIMAGTYQTYGANAWTVKTGQKLLGSGIDVTVLRLYYSPSYASNDFTYVISSFTPFAGLEPAVTNVEICDLTCDCNYGSGYNTPCGVDLDGELNAVRRIKVINAEYHTNDGTSEAWGIVMQNSQLPSSVGNIVENCEVSHFGGGNGGLSAIAFNSGPTNGISGTIRNNRILLSAMTSGDGLFAINGGAEDDVLIEGNYIEGADFAFYSDTFSSTNLIIVNNILDDCMAAASYGSAYGRNNITFAFNNITIKPLDDDYGVFNFWGAQNTNVFIFGNTIALDGQGPTTKYPLNASNVTGLIFDDNAVDAILASNQLTTIYFTNNFNVTIDGNHDLFGNYLWEMNIPTVGGVEVSPLGFNLVTSIEASSALTNLGLPSNPQTLVTNNEAGVTLGGTFSGSGNGLTNVAATTFSGTLSSTNLPYYIRAGTTNTSGFTTGMTVYFSTPVPNNNYSLSIGWDSDSESSWWCSAKATNYFTLSFGSRIESPEFDYTAVEQQ